MSSSLINTLLVVGLLGGAVLAFIKRCEWFQVCGANPLQELTDKITGAVKDSGLEDVLADPGSDKEKTLLETHGSPIDPDKTDAVLAKRGQDSATVAKGIKETFAAPSAFHPKPGHVTCAVRNNQLMSIGSKGEILGPCGTTVAAKYARSNLAALTVYGGRMSYN